MDRWEDLDRLVREAEIEGTSLTTEASIRFACIKVHFCGCGMEKKKRSKTRIDRAALRKTE
jgi:hypothetical protein